MTLFISFTTSALSVEDCGTKKPHAFNTNLIGHLDEESSMDLWSEKESKDLSFCIDELFGSSYENMKLALIESAREWMKYANVDFKIVENISCSNTLRNVLFKVVPVTRRAKYKARAFFPSSERRKIQINRRYTDLAQPELKQLILHELGHVLGFRHEHVHIDNTDDCAELEPFEPITDYDPLSIMHYKSCSLGGLRNYVLSDLDKLGAQLAYPF